MPQNFYELVWIFAIYAVVGWCTEVAYATVDTGKFVNRGFLNGPYCPIYGFGVVIVVGLLTPMKDNLAVLFAGSFLLTSLLEFVTGFLLEKVFHNKWWDYSDKPFNIMGYVCLKFSIYWGLACVFVVDILHPIIYKFITTIPYVLGMVLIHIIMLMFAVDSGITVMTILNFNKRLKHMDEIAKRIHNISDELGEVVYENVTTIMEKREDLAEKQEELRGELRSRIDETKETFGEAREELRNRIDGTKENYEKKIQELEELNRRYVELLEQKNFGFKRLMNAFPDVKSRDWNEVLDKYKEHLNKRFK